MSDKRSRFQTGPATRTRSQSDAGPVLDPTQDANRSRFQTGKAKRMIDTQALYDGGYRGGHHAIREEEVQYPGKRD